MENPKGRLWLIPNVISPAAPLEAAMPATALARIKLLRRFVVEGDRAAWRLLSRVMDKAELEAVTMEKLDEHTKPEDVPALLAPLLAGEDLGLLSEAGLPCIADPGGALVAAAHRAGIEVKPLVGPSSLLLALGASGLDGQRFTFLGYLPQDRGQRRNALVSIERGVKLDGGTRLFIETPYRNDRLLEDCLGVLSPETRLCVAADLSSDSERVLSMSVAEWRERKPVLGKVPAVFLVGRVPGTGLDPARAKDDRLQACKNKRR